MVNIELLELNYFQNGYDVPYELKKGGTINIKPILVKDYSLYEFSKDILEIKKNEINDVNIIQMSYLEFIEKIINEDKEGIFATKLLTIFDLCLGEINISFEKNKNKTVIAISDDEGIINKIISSKEFEDIIKIILNQNDYAYDNRYITPEVRELMYEYNKIKYKDINSPSLEKRKAFVCSKLGKSFSEINEMIYRQFEMIYQSCVDSEIYIGEKIIQGSYKYKVEEDIPHPLYKKKEDPYSKIFEDTSVLASKGISGAQQLNALNLKGE